MRAGSRTPSNSRNARPVSTSSISARYALRASLVGTLRLRRLVSTAAAPPCQHGGCAALSARRLRRLVSTLRALRALAFSISAYCLLKPAPTELFNAPRVLLGGGAGCGLGSLAPRYSRSWGGFSRRGCRAR